MHRYQSRRHPPASLTKAGQPLDVQVHFSRHHFIDCIPSKIEYQHITLLAVLVIACMPGDCEVHFRKSCTYWRFTAVRLELAI